jgi:hypothetical protein
MKKLRRVTEAEVISEFLRNEFYQEEFHHDREQFEDLVLQADLSDEDANALRRALLFRRRGHMWREIPEDTAWWEVQIGPEDLDRVRVFPRAQWRKVANGSFLLKDIAQRVKHQRYYGKTRDFVTRVQALSYKLRSGDDQSAVLLIGIDDSQPVTILEGNHRLTAALLASPEILRSRFRVFCGLSPRMSESCWYQTNVSNLWRYAKNRARNLFYDRDADVERLMNPADREQPATTAPASVAAHNTAANSK